MTRRKKDEITIRVEPNHMTDEIIVVIPPCVWDVDNLAEGIKQAVLMTVGHISDGLDS